MCVRMVMCVSVRVRVCVCVRVRVYTPMCMSVCVCMFQSILGFVSRFVRWETPCPTSSAPGNCRVVRTDSLAAHSTEVGPPERDKTDGPQELNDGWVRSRSASDRLY